MLKPKKLVRGDTVAIVSLSSGMGGEVEYYHKVELGMQRLQEVFGLHPILMSNALKGIAYLDAHPEARAADLMDAFKDPNIKAIITMIGGDDSIRLLPYIDFQVLHDNPKILLGYSDTTITHFMLYKAGVVSFYGPALLTDFAENVAMHDYTVAYLQKVLFEKEEMLPVVSSPEWTSEFLDWTDPKNNAIKRTMQKEELGYEVLQGTGVVEGKLIGGCIDVLPMIMGTTIWPSIEKWKDTILFLETSEEHPTPSTVKYLLRGLAAQGILKEVQGIIFGKPKDNQYYDEYKAVLRQVLKECDRSDMPVLYNLNFGHTAPICVLPYGVSAKIDCDNKAFYIVEAAVE